MENGLKHIFKDKYINTSNMIAVTPTFTTNRLKALSMDLVYRVLV